MTTGTERRRAPRVSSAIPVRLTATGRSLEGIVRDISRIGTRIRVPLSELDLSEEADLSQVAARLGQTLGDVVVADLNHVVLGTLVRRSLRVVRLSRPADDPSTVDIGCMLRIPLSDDEVGALNVTLPEQHLPDGVYTAHEVFSQLKRKRREDAGADQKESATAGAMAFLSADANHAAPPVRASDAAWTDQGVLLRFGRRTGAILGSSSRDAGALFERFVRDYGTDVGLLLVRNHHPLWSGAVRLRAVEVDPLRDDVYLEFESTQAGAQLPAAAI